MDVSKPCISFHRTHFVALYLSFDALTAKAPQPKIRVPKSGSRVVTVTKPGQRNNGNIEVIMDSEPVQLIPQVMRAAYEEVRINGQRYRVPEQTIVLDFWKKAKRNRMREVSR